MRHPLAVLILFMSALSCSDENVSVNGLNPPAEDVDMRMGADAASSEDGMSSPSLDMGLTPADMPPDTSDMDADASLDQGLADMPKNEDDGTTQATGCPPRSKWSEVPLSPKNYGIPTFDTFGVCKEFASYNKSKIVGSIDKIRALGFIKALDAGRITETWEDAKVMSVTPTVAGIRIIRLGQTMDFEWSGPSLNNWLIVGQDVSVKKNILAVRGASWHVKTPHAELVTWTAEAVQPDKESLSRIEPYVQGQWKAVCGVLDEYGAVYKLQMERGGQMVELNPGEHAFLDNLGVTLLETGHFKLEAGQRRFRAHLTLIRVEEECAMQAK